MIAGSRKSQKATSSSLVGIKESSLYKAYLISAPKNGNDSNTLQKRRYITYSTVRFL